MFRRNQRSFQMNRDRRKQHPECLSNNFREIFEFLSAMFSCSDVPIGRLIAFSSPIPLIFVFHCYLKFWNENWIDSHTERWRRQEKNGSSQMFFIYKDFTKFPSAHQLIAFSKIIKHILQFSFLLLILLRFLLGIFTWSAINPLFFVCPFNVILEALTTHHQGRNFKILLVFLNWRGRSIKQSGQGAEMHAGGQKMGLRTRF